MKKILADEFLNPSTPEGLLYCVFFQIAINFACQGEEHYGLYVDQFHSPLDVNKVGNFMKDIGKSVKVDLLPGILMNHSGHKTVVQILQDADVPKDAIMGVTGHKSVQKSLRSSILGDSTNTNIADTPVEFSFDDNKKFPIFNNCHFNNVTFKL
ncbi:hypothetical protein C1646_751450 [Rhizophagus diaphanus]|nr:hypothetical protein C1646_751450 [Rhizophagus diaphanus] [Rhizophagus sp. MUCL 43196]